MLRLNCNRKLVSESTFTRWNRENPARLGLRNRRGDESVFCVCVKLKYILWFQQVEQNVNDSLFENEPILFLSHGSLRSGINVLG